MKLRGSLLLRHLTLMSLLPPEKPMAVLHSGRSMILLNSGKWKIGLHPEKLLALLH